MSSVIGVIGAGQLARMMISPATNLGVEIRVLAASEGEPAHLATTVVGDYRDWETVLAFAEGVDVITFDHEHVPQAILRELVSRGFAVHPGPDALQFAQDKLLMRERLTELGIACPDWARASNADELGRFLDQHGGRAVVKTPRGGYDGKGVRVVSEAHEVDDWFLALAEDGRGGDLLVEEVVEFRRELAQLVARRPSGGVAAWPVVETVQLDGICTEVLAPAPGCSARLARVAEETAVAIAEGIGATGVLAVELFETTDDRLLVNELAMRPHNSGHWTIDGSITSQFEQHLRAILDLPLGSTRCRETWSVMTNILGGPTTGTLYDRYERVLREHPNVKIHDYGKQPRPGRKIGHVTVSGDDLDQVAYEARAAQDILTD